MPDLFTRAKLKAQQAIQGVGNFLDQDKSMAGIQAVQGGLGNRITQNFAPQNVRQMASNVSQGFVLGGVGAGVDRLKQSFQQDPMQHLPSRAMSNVVPAAQIAFSPGNYLQGKAPTQFAQDVSYGLRGATQLTPFQAVNYLGLDETGQQQYQQSQPTTDRQKAAQDIGRYLYGSALTAPMAGPGLLPKLAMVGKNTATGVAFGAGASAIGDVLQGQAPSLDRMGEGAFQGATNSWIYPLTNAATDTALKTAGKSLPFLNQFTDDALRASGNTIKQGTLREIFRQAPKQIVKGAIREASETPLETGYFAAQDTADNGGDYLTNYKNRFVEDLLSNAVMGGARQGIGLTPATIKAGKAEYDKIPNKEAGFAKLGPDPKLPDSLSKAKPRYNYGSKAFMPEFKSDVDKALYITAQTTKSKSDDAYRNFLKENGFSDQEILVKGQEIRAFIKQQASVRVGGNYAKPEKIVVDGFNNRGSSRVQPKQAPKTIEQVLKPTPAPEAKTIQQVIDNKTPSKEEVEMFEQMKTVLEKMKESSTNQTQPKPQAVATPEDPLKVVGKEMGKVRSELKKATDPEVIAELKDKEALLKETYANLKGGSKKRSQAGTNPLTADSPPNIKAQIEAYKQQFGQETPKKKSATRKLIERASLPIYNRLKAGGKAGEEVVNLHKKSVMESEMEAGGYNTRLEKLSSSLTPQQKADIGDYIEGKKPIDSPQLQRFIDEWRLVGNEIQAKAEGAGLDTGYLKDYFPHIPKNPEDLFDQLVAKGIDPNQAKRRVDTYMSRTKERKFSSLDYSREFPEIDYRKDIGVLFDYIKSATKRYTEARLFGPKDEIMYSLAGQTKDTGSAKEYVDQLIGKGDYAGPQKGAGLSKFVRGVQTVIKLNPITSVLNLTQNISTLAKTDLPSFSRALVKVMSNPSEAYAKAKALGEIEPDMVRVFGQDYKNDSTVGKYIKLIGMYGTERFNRVMAVNAGEIYAQKMMKQASNGDQAAIRELKRLGVDWVKDSSLEAAQKMVDYAAKNTSVKTQFSAPEGELPASWQSPAGKVVTQFKGFAYQQSKFVKNETIRAVEELAKGNAKPLLNDLIAVGVAAPIAGEILADVTAIVRNKKREDMTLAQRYVDNIKNGTSLGLIESLFSMFKYGESGAVGTAFGPTGSDALKTIKAGSDAYKGLTEYDSEKGFLDNVDPDSTTRRFLLGNIPIVGKTLSNTFVDNAAIDNTFGGVNEGLDRKDKETYNLLRDSGNDSQAEDFKSQNQWLSKKGEDKQNFLEAMFGDKKEATSTIPTNGTVQEKKDYKAGITKILENGGVPDNEQVKFGVFEGKSATSDSLEDRNKVYKTLSNALNNPDYTDEQKQAIIKASGASQEQAEYFNQADKVENVKLQNMIPVLAGLNEKDRLAYLGQSRMMIGGKQLLTSGMITYLYDNEIISKQEQKWLSSLKFDEIQNKFYMSRNYKGGSGGGGNMSYKQALALFKLPLPKFSQLKDLTSLLRTQTKRQNGQTSSSGANLIEDILYKPKRKSQGNLWFS